MCSQSEQLNGSLGRMNISCVLEHDHVKHRNRDPATSTMKAVQRLVCSTRRVTGFGDPGDVSAPSQRAREVLPRWDHDCGPTLTHEEHQRLLRCVNMNILTNVDGDEDLTCFMNWK